MRWWQRVRCPCPRLRRAAPEEGAQRALRREKLGEAPFPSLVPPSPLHLPSPSLPIPAPSFLCHFHFSFPIPTFFYSCSTNPLELFGIQILLV